MERRWTTRAQVSLLQSGTHTEGCRTRDVGLGGVYIELPPNLKLFAESHVELIFRLGEGSEITKHRVKARVVRVGDTGAGMMFRDFDATTFRSLQEILRTREGAVSP